MTRGLLALVIWLGLAASAWAQHPGGGYAGYQFPNVGAGNCSPVCTGASISLTIPPGLTGGSTLFAWLGVETITGDGTVINGIGLGQFGIKVTGSSVALFWEMACAVGGTACNGEQTITGFTVSAGDTLLLNMACTSVTCNASSGETWAVTATDTNTNTVCIIHNATTCGTSGQTLNWPLSINNFVYAGIFETDGVVTWSAPAHWANATYTTGNPGSQVVHNVPLNPGSNLWTVGSGAGAGKSVSASAPVGVNGNDFNVCPPVTSATFNPCAAGWYGGTVPVLGP